MDIKLFTQIMRDQHFPNYQKLRYQYPSDFSEFLNTLHELYCKPLPLPDFSGNPVVYLENYALIHSSMIRLLLQPQTDSFGIRAAEEEIISSSKIENIDFSRDSVRSILKGLAPKDEQENRILGQKHGLEFIADLSHPITEENLHRLYQMTIGDFLTGDDRLPDGHLYRHDEVFVISDHIEHSGIPHTRLPAHVQALIAFIHTDDGIDPLVKGAMIHFYFAYLHPYFDGNGRMSRLLHLWYLIQNGCRSALFIPFSSQIAKTKKAYYDAFTLVEKNAQYSGRIDLTPFLLYFVKDVYNRIAATPQPFTERTAYTQALREGKVTEKESQLWKFVLSQYGTEEFSTKQLEKDFGNAAYATIRSFVLKFEQLELLSSTKYGTRVKYKVR